MRHRIIHHNGTTYQVNRLYSSGIGGAQYSAEPLTGTASKKKEVILLTEETVRQNPELRALFEACHTAYDDNITFYKHVGDWTP